MARLREIMTTNNDPLAAAKAELVELEGELTQRLEEMDRSDSRPKMDSAVGRLTFMDELQQYQMAEHGRRNVESRLGGVRAALSRVEDGTFGKCVRCGLDIPPERLEFMPEAAHCVQCQSRSPTA
jgi:DnaK suppressor protein